MGARVHTFDNLAGRTETQKTATHTNIDCAGWGRIVTFIKTQLKSGGGGEVLAKPTRGRVY